MRLFVLFGDWWLLRGYFKQVREGNFGGLIFIRVDVREKRVLLKIAQSNSTSMRKLQRAAEKINEVITESVFQKSHIVGELLHFSFGVFSIGAFLHG